ncbi:alanine racemase [Brachybacterium hainanense]|uniref:Alanine racemase n=1 Tax=Brachybacterium hainanense TaxID=1541174 RepID=A0ABV6RCA3_9MICO
MTLPCSGMPPLTARTETWMEDLLSDPAQAAALIREHGSPVNVLDLSPLRRNVDELVTAAASEGVDLQVFVARKANKALTVVEEALACGAGVDVASPAELEQSLRAGAPGHRVIVTAATKSDALLARAAASGAAVSLDNLDETAALARICAETGAEAEVALRIASADPRIPPTRFGLRPEVWLEHLDELPARLRIGGVHFHLNGYSAAERSVVLAEACRLVDALRAAGHPVHYVDMGGGIPMRYLEDAAQWRTFWEALAAARSDEVTWRGDALGLVDPARDRPSPAVYPFWQEAVRGSWIREVLTAQVEGTTPARLLVERGLELRCEPGRSVLDGCGLTLAEVAFRKESSDGRPLVGLHMNRTQLRSTSADVLLDPRWLRPPSAGEPGPATDAFLVGAYCIEEELILRRRLRLPQGAARGDVVAFVNTAGYLMHILESASHQLPLAATVVRRDGSWVRDGIDAVAPTGPPAPSPR